MMNISQPIRTILSTAPIRIADCGGWTDTWFAEYGAVFNIAVNPGVHIRLETYDKNSVQHRVYIQAENFRDAYAWDPGMEKWERHPLIEAAIALAGIPDDISIRVVIASDAPAGASTGTSASVSVALLAALFALNGRLCTPDELASSAHHLEYNVLGMQCGIQDQLCAAYGGVNFIDMERFPKARVTQLSFPKDFSDELNRRLKLIYLGKSHRSSDVHHKVISKLENLGPENQLLHLLRSKAVEARDAALARNLAALGNAMKENTGVQELLHPDLLNIEARRAIDIARSFGALGWKLNGAGGEGGSLTVLCGNDDEKNTAMIRAMEHEIPLLKNIAITLSPEGAFVCDG